jgi:hypothetical protein
MGNKKLELKIKNQQNQISELYVLIDTLQTNLRSAVSEIPPMDRKKVTDVQSFKWSVNWKAGDEKP